MLVSIITVVYNGEKYLEQTINSVLSQSYKNIEYIIIDGGSTDGTVDIIKKYDANIAYWISEPDAGIYDAMNKGIAEATGDVIGIVNSDDWYERNTVETIVGSMKIYPNGGVFFGLKRKWLNEKVISVEGNNSDVLLQRYMIAHPTCFVRKDVYKRFGGFSTKYTIAADYDLLLRLKLKDVGFVFIEQILTNFRLGGVSDKYQIKGRIERLKIFKSHNLIGKFFFLRKWTMFNARLVISFVVSLFGK